MNTTVVDKKNIASLLCTNHMNLEEKVSSEEGKWK